MKSLYDSIILIFLLTSPLEPRHLISFVLTSVPYSSSKGKVLVNAIATSRVGGNPNTRLWIKDGRARLVKGPSPQVWTNLRARTLLSLFGTRYILMVPARQSPKKWSFIYKYTCIHTHSFRTITNANKKTPALFNKPPTHRLWSYM